MNKDERDFFIRVKEAIYAVPKLNIGGFGPSQTVSNYVSAYQDFSEVCSIAAMAMDKFLYWQTRKHFLNKPEIDPDYIDEINASLPRAYELVEQLETYVQNRKNEAWA